ncbi:MAG: nuclear transport factor 2 family protein [Pyrinomonadaceae bacterium]
MKRIVLFAVSACLLSVVVGIGHGQSGASSKIRKAVAELEGRYQKAWKANDEKEVLDLFTEDAAIFPFGNTSFKGRDELRGFWFGSSASSTRITFFETTPIDIFGSKNSAFAVGKQKLEWETKDETGIKRYMATGNFSAVYLKIEGVWKIHRRQWSNAIEEIKD